MTGARAGMRESEGGVVDVQEKRPSTAFWAFFAVDVTVLGTFTTPEGKIPGQSPG